MVIIVAEFKKSPQSGEKNRAKREKFLKSRREAAKKIFCFCRESIP